MTRSQTSQFYQPPAFGTLLHVSRQSIRDAYIIIDLFARIKQVGFIERGDIYSFDAVANLGSIVGWYLTYIHNACKLFIEVV